MTTWFPGQCSTLNACTRTLYIHEHVASISRLSPSRVHNKYCSVTFDPTVQFIRVRERAWKSRLHSIHVKCTCTHQLIPDASHEQVNNINVIIVS